MEQIYYNNSISYKRESDSWCVMMFDDGHVVKFYSGQIGAMRGWIKCDRPDIIEIFECIDLILKQ